MRCRRRLEAWRRGSRYVCERLSARTQVTRQLSVVSTAKQPSAESSADDNEHSQLLGAMGKELLKTTSKAAAELKTLPTAGESAKRPRVSSAAAAALAATQAPADHTAGSISELSFSTLYVTLESQRKGLALLLSQRRPASQHASATKFTTMATQLALDLQTCIGSQAVTCHVCSILRQHRITSRSSALLKLEDL